jgi:hypothetical protein
VKYLKTVEHDSEVLNVPRKKTEYFYKDIINLKNTKEDLLEWLTVAHLDHY